MGKKASRKVGNKRVNSIFSNKKVSSQETEERKQKLEDKLLELSDSEIEALFQAGKIDQAEYEYILEFRKRKKERKKSQKEKFEERIRCNNVIIEKVIKLGRIFRLQEMMNKQSIGKTKRETTSIESLDEQDIEKDERIRTKNEKTREKGRSHEERGFGRGREIDR